MTKKAARKWANREVPACGVVKKVKFEKPLAYGVQEFCYVVVAKRIKIEK